MVYDKMATKYSAQKDWSSLKKTIFKDLSRIDAAMERYKRGSGEFYNEIMTLILVLETDVKSFKHSILIKD